MLKMRIIFIIITSLIVLSCNKNEEATYVLPKTYLPAYPKSSWDYSNGERIIVSPNYQAHSYPNSINSTSYSATKYVPYLNGQYLYEYSVYQNFTAYPLKQLLSESKNSSWVVNEINNEKIFRKVIATSDSMLMSIQYNGAYKDTMIKPIITVVEYLDSLGVDRWNLKEYYAKNIGLIRVDVNNPYDEEPFIIQKQLIRYNIDK